MFINDVVSTVNWQNVEVSESETGTLGSNHQIDDLVIAFGIPGFSHPYIKLKVSHIFQNGSDPAVVQ